MPNKILVLLTGWLLVVGPAIAQQTPAYEAVESSQAFTPAPPGRGPASEERRTPLQIFTGQRASTAATDPIGENLFAPEVIMAHQKAIALDEAQRNFIRSELLKTQTHFTELQWQLQDAMESLVSLLKEEKVDEQQVLAQLDKVLNAEREIKRTQITLAVRIKNKLTPEQQARLRQLREESPPRAEAPLAPPR